MFAYYPGSELSPAVGVDVLGGFCFAAFILIAILAIASIFALGSRARRLENVPIVLIAEIVTICLTLGVRTVLTGGGSGTGSIGKIVTVSRAVAEYIVGIGAYRAAGAGLAIYGSVGAVSRSKKSYLICHFENKAAGMSERGSNNVLTLGTLLCSILGSLSAGSMSNHGILLATIYTSVRVSVLALIAKDLSIVAVSLLADSTSLGEVTNGTESLFLTVRGAGSILYGLPEIEDMTYAGACVHHGIGSVTVCALGGLGTVLGTGSIVIGDVGGKGVTLLAGIIFTASAITAEA